MLDLQSRLSPDTTFADEEPLINYVCSNGRVQVLYPGQGHLAQDTIKILEDDYSCPVCIQTHEKPLRTRACQHNLCTPCFNRLLIPTPREGAPFSGNLTKKCPTCRHELGSTNTPAAAVLEEIPGAKDAVGEIYRNCRVVAEPVEPITLFSVAKSFWSAIPTILSIPFRASNTALNLGLFAGYYVTVVACTTLGAFTGATVGFSNSLKNILPGQQPRPSTKSIREYTVDYAKNTFNYLSIPYNALPFDSHSVVLPTLSSLALFCVELWAARRIGLSVITISTNYLYDAIFKLMYKISAPYTPITERTVSLFRKTENYIHSF